MRKKINPYSWIHQLNESVLESKLIAEAKLFADAVSLNEENNPFGKAKKASPAAREQLGAQLAGTRPASQEDAGDLSSVDPKTYARILSQELGKYGPVSAHSIALDPEAKNPMQNVKDYIDIRRAKTAGVQQKRRDMVPTDVNGDGDADAEDVKLDVQDNIAGNEDARMPFYGWAHSPSEGRRVRTGGIGNVPPAQYSGTDPNAMTRAANARLRQNLGTSSVDQDLAASIDAALDRMIKTAPPGKTYTIQDLHHMARLLGS